MVNVSTKDLTEDIATVVIGPSGQEVVFLADVASSDGIFSMTLPKDLHDNLVSGWV